MNLLDTFSGPDGQELSQHPMNQGNGWVKILDAATLEDNSMASGQANPLYLTDAQAPTGTLMVAPIVDLGDAQIALHLAKDAQSRYGYVIICYPADGKIEIWTADTANTMSLQMPFAFAAGKQQWKVRMMDHKLSFFIAGKLIAVLPNIAPTNGWWGLELYKPGGAPQSRIAGFHFIEK